MQLITHRQAKTDETRVRMNIISVEFHEPYNSKIDGDNRVIKGESVKCVVYVDYRGDLHLCVILALCTVHLKCHLAFDSITIDSRQ